MGRQVINNIECVKCHKEFDVATEDIEWEHLEDAGESDVHPGMKDYHVWQKIKCPKCGYANQIIYCETSNQNTGHLAKQEVISMEIEILQEGIKDSQEL